MPVELECAFGTHYVLELGGPGPGVATLSLGLRNPCPVIISYALQVAYVTAPGQPEGAVGIWKADPITFSPGETKVFDIPVTLVEGLHGLYLHVWQKNVGFMGTVHFANADYRPYEPPPPPPAVTVYEHTNYGGQQRSFDAVDLADLRVHPYIPDIGTAMHDSISSVKVTLGHSITLYGDINYGGTAWKIESDAPDLRRVVVYLEETYWRDAGWYEVNINDLASSLKVR